MAEHGDRLLTVEFREPRGYFAHRDITGPVDAGKIDLPGFSDVEQLPKFAGSAQPLELGRCHFLEHASDPPVITRLPGYGARRREAVAAVSV